MKGEFLIANGLPTERPQLQNQINASHWKLEVSFDTQVFVVLSNNYSASKGFTPWIPRILHVPTELKACGVDKDSLK